MQSKGILNCLIRRGSEEKKCFIFPQKGLSIGRVA